MAPRRYGDITTQALQPPPHGAPPPVPRFLPSPGAQYPTVHRGPGSDPTWGGGRGPPRGSGKGGLDRGRAHRGGDAAPLPDAAPGARPRSLPRPRGLPSQGLDTSCGGGGGRGPCPRPDRRVPDSGAGGPRRALFGVGAAGGGSCCAPWTPSPPAGRSSSRCAPRPPTAPGAPKRPERAGLGKGLAARPLPRRGPHSSEGPGLGGGARLASRSRRGPALRPQQGLNKLSWCCGPVRSFFACQLWGQAAPGPRLGGEGALGPPAHAVLGRGERRCSQARPAGGASGRDSC